MYQAPFVAPQPASSSEPKVVNVSLESSPWSHEKFIILHTRDLERDELDLIGRYGKILPFEPKVYSHLQPSEFSDQFDYLFIDLRVSQNRRYYERVDKSGFKLLCLVHFFEKESNFVESLGSEVIVKTKLPPIQVFKKDFDALLLARTLCAPNRLLSCVSFFLNALRTYSSR
jgi:hypothetical protein